MFPWENEKSYQRRMAEQNAAREKEMEKTLKKMYENQRLHNQYMESMAYAQTGTATSGSGWTLKDFVLLPYYILRFFYNRYADFYRDFKSLFGGRASRAWLMMGVVALLPFLVFIVIGVLSSLGFIVYLNDTAMDYFDYRNRIDNLMINSFLIGFAVHWLAIIVTALWKMRSFPKFDIRMGVRIAKNSFLLLVIHYFATLLLFS